MSFNETEVNRATDGKFAEKTGASPEVKLDAPTPALRAMPRMPGSEREDAIYANVDSFAGIDEIWTQEVTRADENDDYLKRMLTTDAAAARSRELRERGLAPTTPTQLQVGGFFGQPFAECQNDVELYHQFSMMTEETPGDGEASKSQVDRWLQRVYDDHDARRAELVAAGVVSGKDTITE
jgi:hypothetical protein